MDIVSVDSSNAATSSKRKTVPKPWGSSLSLPKLKKIKRELLTDLHLKSHECQSEIMPLMSKSFHWRTSSQLHEFTRVQSVHNPELTAKYQEKKREMKSCGYSDLLVTDSYAFLPVDTYSMVEQICRKGVKCGNQKFSGLGVSHMAVHLCKCADVLSPAKPIPGDKICLVVKVLKGKVKSVVCRTVGVQLEPTPNFDCHIAKLNTDPSLSLPLHQLFYSLQLYVYEYGDLGMEEYPKQILPYAVVYYSLNDSLPQSLTPQMVPSFPSKLLQTISKSLNSSRNVPMGPSNEIWKGRLHLRLIGGGHIYLDVSILSHFVPLAITLLSPITVSYTYPNTNAQLTFLAGLSEIATKHEVPWRDYFFRSFLMKPSSSSEAHFKSLVRHISNKQEMIAVRLSKEVYLFLLPKCLLASQLGLVQGNEDKTVMYCLLMSKVSTIKKHKSELEKRVGKKMIRKCGKAKFWEELFEDSDSDEKESMSNGVGLHTESVRAMFEQQRPVHNRLAAMSFEDANVIFTPCGCGKPESTAAQIQRYRNTNIQREVTSIYNQIASRETAKNQTHFPPGSRRKPKQHMSRHSKSMPSFSPHGSSSDSDSDSMEQHNNGSHCRRRRKRLAILDTKKTVEEELSEEELTNEQMEAIIFMRKPNTTASTTAKLPPPKDNSSSFSTKVHPKQSPSNNSKVELLSPPTSPGSPVLVTQPKIIPTEPLEDLQSSTIASPPREEPPSPSAINAPVIIPTEPISSPHNTKAPTLSVQSKPIAKVNLLQKRPKSILKKSTCITPLTAHTIATTIVSSKSSESSPSNLPPDTITSSKTPAAAPASEKLPIVDSPESPPSVTEADMGDVDMRITPHLTTLSTPFSLAKSPPVLKRSPDQIAQPISWSQGSWLAPGEFPPQVSKNGHSPRGSVSTNKYSDLSMPHSPSGQVQQDVSSSLYTDASPPSNSPPSPSPLSPPSFDDSLPIDSPPSPISSPAMAETESPASPPQYYMPTNLRSSPIAIPTVRVRQPEHGKSPSQVSPASPEQFKLKGDAENASDMMEFLNNAGSGLDSDSPHEDDR